MPSVANVGPYRFFFYSNESGALREVERILQDRAAEFLEAWNEHFGG